MLASASHRHAISKAFENLVIARMPLEKPQGYEERVVNEVTSSFAGSSKVRSSCLLLPKVRSKPDGVIEQRTSCKITLVEAKMLKPNFADGLAQLIQYYGQLFYCAEWKQYKVKLLLVSAVPEPDCEASVREGVLNLPESINIYVCA
jgi:hypothetical protein